MKCLIKFIKFLLLIYFLIKKSNSLNNQNQVNSTISSTESSLINSQRDFLNQLNIEYSNLKEFLNNTMYNENLFIGYSWARSLKDILMLHKMELKRDYADSRIVHKRILLDNSCDKNCKNYLHVDKTFIQIRKLFFEISFFLEYELNKLNYPGPIQNSVNGNKNQKHIVYKAPNSTDLVTSSSTQHANTYYSNEITKVPQNISRAPNSTQLITEFTSPMYYTTSKYSGNNTIEYNTQQTQVSDYSDETIDNASSYNRTKRNDLDGDGFEDICYDFNCLQDNCPHDFNADQKDYDRDGIGDECDPDPKTPFENFNSNYCITNMTNGTCEFYPFQNITELFENRIIICNMWLDAIQVSENINISNFNFNKFYGIIFGYQTNTKFSILMWKLMKKTKLSAEIIFFYKTVNFSTRLNASLERTLLLDEGIPNKIQIKENLTKTIDFDSSVKQITWAFYHAKSDSHAAFRVFSRLNKDPNEILYINLTYPAIDEFNQGRFGIFNEDMTFAENRTIRFQKLNN